MISGGQWWARNDNMLKISGYAVPMICNMICNKALAWANGFGFPESQAGPKPYSGRDFGPAWLGLIGPGLAWPTA